MQCRKEVTERNAGVKVICIFTNFCPSCCLGLCPFHFHIFSSDCSITYIKKKYHNYVNKNTDFIINLFIMTAKIINWILDTQRFGFRPLLSLFQCMAENTQPNPTPYTHFTPKRQWSVSELYQNLQYQARLSC